LGRPDHGQKVVAGRGCEKQSVSDWTRGQAVT